MFIGSILLGVGVARDLSDDHRQGKALPEWMTDEALSGDRSGPGETTLFERWEQGTTMVFRNRTE